MNKRDFLLPVPANPPDAGTQQYIVFGADWIPVLLAVVSELGEDTLWLSPPTDIQAQVDELMARIQTPVIVQPQVYAQNQYLFFNDVFLSNGAAIIPVVDTAQLFNGYWRQSPSVIDDEWYFVVAADAGILPITVFGITGANSGKITFTTDEGHTATIDMYSAATVRNAVKASTIQFDTPGLHSIVGKMHTKNASSGGYALLCDYIKVG